MGGFFCTYKLMKKFNKNKISWIELDVSESIEIRKTFFKETDSYKMIAK